MKMWSDVTGVGQCAWKNVLQCEVLPVQWEKMIRKKCSLMWSAATGVGQRNNEMLKGYDTNLKNYSEETRTRIISMVLLYPSSSHHPSAKTTHQVQQLHASTSSGRSSKLSSSSADAVIIGLRQKLDPKWESNWLFPLPGTGKYNNPCHWIPLHFPKYSLLSSWMPRLLLA